MAKKPQIKNAVEKVEIEAPKEVTPKKEVDKSVSVTNVSKARFVQPSSGTILWPGNTKPVNNDSWLKNQMDAGYLVKA